EPALETMGPARSDSRAHIHEHGAAPCDEARGRHDMSPISSLMEGDAQIRGGISRVESTIRIRQQPSRYCRTEWGHRRSVSAPVQRWGKTCGRNARDRGQSHERREKALA